MKGIKLNLKVVAQFLAFLILSQGCTVYKSNPVSVKDAVLASEKVKIVDSNNIYKFKYLEEIDGKTYGTLVRNSKTARLLSNQISEKDGHKKLVKIHLTEEQLTAIYLKNNSLSKTLTVLSFVAVPLGLAILLVVNIEKLTSF